MSIRDYAVDDYGLLLTNETMKVVASKVCDDFEDMEDDEYGYALYEEGVCEYISDFTGEANLIDDNGLDDWTKNGEMYSGDQVYYIQASSCLTLFKAAYSDMDELIEEFKSKVGEYLPDGFNYREYIRHITGTYFG